MKFKLIIISSLLLAFGVANATTVITCPLNDNQWKTTVIVTDSTVTLAEHEDESKEPSYTTVEDKVWSFKDERFTSKNNGNTQTTYHWVERDNVLHHSMVSINEGVVVNAGSMAYTQCTKLDIK